jgi:hypothetical protein
VLCISQYDCRAEAWALFGHLRVSVKQTPTDVAAHGLSACSLEALLSAGSFQVTSCDSGAGPLLNCWPPLTHPTILLPCADQAGAVAGLGEGGERGGAGVAHRPQRAPAAQPERRVGATGACSGSKFLLLCFPCFHLIPQQTLCYAGWKSGDHNSAPETLRIDPAARQLAWRSSIMQ